jgi:hypothetical protein
MNGGADPVNARNRAAPVAERRTRASPGEADPREKKPGS